MGKRIIIGTVCAAVFVVVIILLCLTRSARLTGAAALQPSREQAEAPPDSTNSALGETTNDAAADMAALDGSIEERDVELVETPRGTREISKSEVDILVELVKRRRIEVADSRRSAFNAIEPYFTAGERLREAARERYGQLTEGDIATVVAKAEELEESFWAMGDFGNPDSLAAIYEARAILEVALDQYPDNENLLKSMIEVHMCGWPTNNGVPEDLSDPLYQTYITRSMEVSEYLGRLWEKHISQKDPGTLTFEDMAYCYDLTDYAAGVSPAELLRLREYLDVPGNVAPKGFREHFVELIARPPVTIEQRLAALDAALLRAKDEGGQWWRYRSAFGRARETLAEKGFIARNERFPVFLDTYYEDNHKTLEPYSEFKYELWRGSAFKGPPGRRERLMPISTYNENLVA